jgi:hypothetical protein
MSTQLLSLKEQQLIKCSRHPGEDALVRHLDFGWLCCSCAAKEGYPLAIQLMAQRVVERLMEPALKIEGVQ